MPDEFLFIWTSILSKGVQEKWIANVAQSQELPLYAQEIQSDQRTLYARVPPERALYEAVMKLVYRPNFVARELSNSLTYILHVVAATQPGSYPALSCSRRVETYRFGISITFRVLNLPLLWFVA
jgi:hypothetical protein